MVAEEWDMDAGPPHWVLVPYLPKSPSQPGAPIPIQASDTQGRKVRLPQVGEVAHPSSGTQPLSPIHTWGQAPRLPSGAE